MLEPFFRAFDYHTVLLVAFAEDPFDDTMLGNFVVRCYNTKIDQLVQFIACLVRDLHSVGMTDGQERDVCHHGGKRSFTSSA